MGKMHNLELTTLEARFVKAVMWHTRASDGARLERAERDGHRRLVEALQQDFDLSHTIYEKLAAMDIHGKR